MCCFVKREGHREHEEWWLRSGDQLISVLHIDEGRHPKAKYEENNHLHSRRHVSLAQQKCHFIRWKKVLPG